MYDTEDFSWLIVLHTGLDLFIFHPFPSHSLSRTDSFLWSITEMTHSTRFPFLSLSLSLSLDVSCIFCQKTREKDIFSWDAGMFLQSLFCVVFAEAYLDLEACEVWAGAMLFSSICSRVAFAQRETLLTEPVVAPKRQKRKEGERKSAGSVRKVFLDLSSLLYFQNRPWKCKYDTSSSSCSCSLIACVTLLNASVEISGKQPKL